MLCSLTQYMKTGEYLNPKAEYFIVSDCLTTQIDAKVMYIQHIYTINKWKGETGNNNLV